MFDNIKMQLNVCVGPMYFFFVETPVPIKQLRTVAHVLDNSPGHCSRE